MPIGIDTVDSAWSFDAEDIDNIRIAYTSFLFLRSVHSIKFSKRLFQKST